MRKVTLTIIGLAVMVLSGAATVVTQDLWQEPALNLWQALPDNLSFLREQVVGNWRSFLGLNPKTEESSMLSGLAASSTPSEIQQFVDQRVRQELSSFLNQVKTPAIGGGSPAQGGQGPSSGLIVVPLTGDSFSDEAIKAKIKNAFSDQVVVKYDSSGVAGVITPIFNRGPGGDYLFLLAPIRPR